MDVYKLLEEDINLKMASFSAMSPDSEEAVSAIKVLRELYQIKQENDKEFNRLGRDCENLELENSRIELEKMKLKLEEERINLEKSSIERRERSEKIDRYLKIGITVLEVTAPLAFYGIWMHRGFAFEREGTFTSTTFRSLFNKFRPTK